MQLNLLSLYRSVIILYLLAFAVYILFTRQPDYFERELTAGKVITADTMNAATLQKLRIHRGDHPVVQFAEGSQTFYYNGKDNFFQRSFTAGEAVKVVFDPGNPANANIFSFFGYWIEAKELLFSILGFAILLGVAIAITGKNEDISAIEVDAAGKMKYH